MSYEVINNPEDTPNKDVLLVEEPLLEEEDFDWVIEVDDTSEIIPYVGENNYVASEFASLITDPPVYGFFILCYLA